MAACPEKLGPILVAIIARSWSATHCVDVDRCAGYYRMHMRRGDSKPRKESQPDDTTAA
jgi:hypothetical protein